MAVGDAKPGTNFPGGVKATPLAGSAVVESKAASFSVTADDSDKVFLIAAADLVATLPAAGATAKGTRLRFIVEAAALSAGTGFSISPAAADAIAGGGTTAVDDKDLINSGVSDADGDTVQLVCDGVRGWYITDKIGTWAKQA